MTRLPIADRREVRQAAARLLRGERRALAGVLVLTALSALSGLVGPYLLGKIVGGVEAGSLTLSTVDQLALGVLGAAVLHLVLVRYSALRAARLGERFLASLREEAVTRTLALPARVVDRLSTGDLLTRVTSDVGTVGQALRDSVPEVLAGAVHLVVVFVAVFWLDPVLGLVSLAGMPFVVWVVRWYLARARDAYLAESEANGDVAEMSAAVGEGSRTIETYGLRARMVAAADETIARSYRARLRTLALRNVLFPVTTFVNMLPAALVLLVGGFFYAADGVRIEVVVTAVLWVWRLVEPMDRILFWVEFLQRGGASFARIEGIGAHVEPAPAVREPDGDRIEVSGVHYSYVDGHEVLHGVDLVVQPGERLAIVGVSGAGKSTLGRLIAGVDRPGEGSVLVGGVPVAGLTAAGQQRIVLVTQEHHVFIGTVRENLAMAAPDAPDGRLLEALRTVGAGWFEELSEGLDTLLGAGGLELDPAQAQQLALARVEVADPHTLVLDEATSSLDPATARHAERAIAAVRERRTVIAIAHRLQTARDADRIAVVDAGRVVELGSHDELVARDGTYATLWRSWHGT
ncbi:ABC transporter ATP-binding protein [Lentzea flaviverrucosa]|uniref:ABC-type multidrug transport system, ATPase and permease component n=1 Tax=Lentzea flaviverrucosa TaxID=200379 RepID=A0A1H9RL17_9PSEU|nr:ABC transporter ATP-binding protein [Lentzea flaviverrucosa]RDI33052.1 ABC-type multidrug transport system fused ATPase/permease subunit [Lentzea flaviverrucosa]SER73337.1 ABC-type multidrug transport system, ATPase and permease component [Lentzea flaviverrucosa]